MKFTPRRSFWFLFTLAIVSVILSARQPGMIQTPRDAAAGTLQMLLVPVSWSFTRAQSAFDSVLNFGHPSPQNSQRIKFRYDRIITLLKARIDVLQNLLDQTHLLDGNFPGIQPGTLLAANVDGFSTASTDTMFLDRGAQDDRALGAGDPVLAHLSLVGRVIAVGPQTCRVALLTAANMKETARIVRITDGKPLVISGDCLVTGTGLGVLHCELDQSVGGIPPRIGDIVILNDADWPSAINGITLGTVTHIAASDRTALRWSLKISPVCDMQQTHHAVILLRRHARQ